MHSYKYVIKNRLVVENGECEKKKKNDKIKRGEKKGDNVNIFQMSKSDGIYVSLLAVSPRIYWSEKESHRDG